MGITIRIYEILERKEESYPYLIFLDLYLDNLYFSKVKMIDWRMILGESRKKDVNTIYI